MGDENSKFYQTANAPIKPRVGPQQATEMHYVIHTETKYLKGCCRCGHRWGTGWGTSANSQCTASPISTASPGAFCPACPVCNGMAKGAAAKGEQRPAAERPFDFCGCERWYVIKPGFHSAGERPEQMWDEYHSPICLFSQLKPGTKIPIEVESGESSASARIAALISAFCCGLALGIFMMSWWLIR